VSRTIYEDEKDGKQYGGTTYGKIVLKEIIIQDPRELALF
jgi:hypothetical protein